MSSGSVEARFFRLASQGDSLAVGGAFSHGRIYNINVNKAAASAVVNVWAANPSNATSKFASIDGNVRAANIYMPGADCPNGFFIGLDGGNADVTVVYS